jgi:hypothetical protein
VIHPYFTISLIVGVSIYGGMIRCAFRAKDPLSVFFCLWVGVPFSCVCGVAWPLSLVGIFVAALISRRRGWTMDDWIP